MSEQLRDDLLTGAKAIGDFIGVTPRQAFYMLESGQIPGFKLGNKWASRKSKIRGHIEGLEEAAAKAQVA
jgi:hypothetical protein